MVVLALKIDWRDMNPSMEPEASFATFHVTKASAHVRQTNSNFEIDAHDRAMNIHVSIHHCVTCQVGNMEAHSIPR